MMRLQIQFNLALRETLIQKLGLESDYLRSCLVRTEQLLQATEYQKPLRLVRHLESDNNYESVLDFLLAVFMPKMKPGILAYYEKRGERLIDLLPWKEIDLIDRIMETCVHSLHHLYTEMKCKGWKKGIDITPKELSAAFIDFELRPLFPRCIELPLIKETEEAHG